MVTGVYATQRIHAADHMTTGAGHDLFEVVNNKRARLTMFMTSLEIPMSRYSREPTPWGAGSVNIASSRRYLGNSILL